MGLGLPSPSAAFSGMNAALGIGRLASQLAGFHSALAAMRPPIPTFWISDAMCQATKMHRSLQSPLVGAATFARAAVSQSAIGRGFGAVEQAIASRAHRNAVDRTLSGFAPLMVLAGASFLKDQHRFQNIFGRGLQSVIGPEQAAWSAVSAARRLALGGLWLAASPLLADQIGLGTRAAIARGYSGIGAFQQMLEGLAAAADAVADGGDDAEAKLSSLTERLQEDARAAVSSPILNLVGLVVAFLSLLLAIQKPDWADDNAAMQDRILASQEELRTAIRDLAGQRAESGDDAKRKDSSRDSEARGFGGGYQRSNNGDPCSPACPPRKPEYCHGDSYAE